MADQTVERQTVERQIMDALRGAAADAALSFTVEVSPSDRKVVVSSTGPLTDEVRVALAKVEQLLADELFGAEPEDL